MSSWHHAVSQLQYGTVPEWLAGLATSGALFAAWRAATWAKKAALATVATADHSRRQAGVADEQLAISREQASELRQDMAHQRAHADRMHRLTLEQRIDALAPSIVARAKPGTPDQGLTGLVRFTRADYAREIPRGGFLHEAWVHTSEEGRLIPGPPVGMPFDVFSIVLTVDFANVGSVPARIAFDGEDVHELTDWPATSEMSLAPGEMKTIHFERRLQAAAVMDHILQDTTNPELDFFDLGFVVRDPAFNVEDAYEFQADLRVFRRHGSEVRAFPQPLQRWSESVASPTKPRAYLRLDQPTPEERTPEDSTSARGRPPSR